MSALMKIFQVFPQVTPIVDFSEKNHQFPLSIFTTNHHESVAESQRRAEIRGVLHEAPQDLHGALAALLAAVLRHGKRGASRLELELAEIHHKTGGV